MPAKGVPTMRSILVFLILTGLLALLFSVACEVEPEITVDDVDVTLDHATDPFALVEEVHPGFLSGCHPAAAPGAGQAPWGVACG